MDIAAQASQVCFCRRAPQCSEKLTKEYFASESNQEKDLFIKNELTG